MSFNDADVNSMDVVSVDSFGSGCYPLGEIVTSRLVDYREVGGDPQLAPGSVSIVEVADPFVSRWPLQDQQRYEMLEVAADDLARARRAGGLWQRKPGGAYTEHDGTLTAKTDSQWGDPVASSYWLKELGSDAMAAWMRLIPSARALLYLADPWGDESVVDVDGGTVRVDDAARLSWSMSIDAIGIRSRAAVMADLVARRAVQVGSPGGAGLRWLSVACGTALPAFQAACAAGIAPDMLLIDIDRDALGMAVSLAGSVGFAGRLSTKRTNIFRRSSMDKLHRELLVSGGLVKMIDMLGIFEYTGPNLGVDPVGFLQSVWECLAPGGYLVTGQMRADRPRPDFTTGVVQWPYVELRTPDDFMAIIEAAGIDRNRVELHLPEDGVYMIAGITK